MTRHIGWFWTGLTALLVLAVGCAKEGAGLWEDSGPGYNDPGKSSSLSDGLAIGTLGSQDGDRYIKLSESTCSKVMNPDAVQDIKDGTRVFLEFRFVVTSLLSSCYTDAIIVEWASPIDQEEVSLLAFAEAFSSESITAAKYSDPMDIILDWMTTLEDGFLTLHYMIPSSGDKKHGFTLYRGMSNQFYLIHSAYGDTKGSLSDGIVCFDVSQVLPETDGETVKLSLVYIDLNKTEKSLTVDYCSPK